MILTQFIFLGLSCHKPVLSLLLLHQSLLGWRRLGWFLLSVNFGFCLILFLFHCLSFVFFFLLLVFFASLIALFSSFSSDDIPLAFSA